MVIDIISKVKTIEEAEKVIKKIFNKNEFPTKVVFSKSCDKKNVFELIQIGLQERFEIIFKQLRPHLKDVAYALDYGCGSGVLTQMVYDRCGIHIEGIDVRDFRAETVSIPIHQFDGYYVPVEAQYYQCGILTNVIHHEADNEKILEELNRIVSRKLVIIETVPEADDEETAKNDWGRMLLNDTLWNRFFNYANIPVPGTYEIPSNWIKRFEKYGWKCVHSEDLGFDQPTIQDRHHLFVFER
ncbi:MAG: methyltransferase domain-containing protein [Patescibacteria group bacterium]